MAPASTTAVLAVPDRSVAERPETKAPDGSEGQFAGLIAHFVPPQPKLPTPESAPARNRSQESASREDSPGPERVSERTAGPARSEKAQGGASETRERTSAAKPEEADEPQAKTPPAKPEAKDEATAAPAPVKADVEPQTTAQPAQALPLTGVPTFATVPVALPTGTQSAPSAGQAQVQAITSPQVPPIPGPVVSPQVPPTPGPAVKAQVEADLAKAATKASVVTSPAAQAPTTPEGMVPKSAQVQVETDATLPPAPALTQAILAETPAKPQAPSPKVPASEAQPSPIPSKPQAEPPVAITVQEAKQPTLPLAAATPAPRPQTKAPLGPGEDQLRSALAAEATTKGTAAPAASLEGALSVPEAALAKLAQPQQGSVLAQPETGSALAAVATSRQTGPAPVSAAPVAAPPAAPPPPNPPTAQVEGSVRWMLKGGAQEAKLQLHPESLGQVTIHLKVEGGEVHARLWITEPASVQAVQEGRPHLEQSLKDQGLQLGSFDLQQGQRPFQEAPSAPAFRGSLPSDPVVARQEAPALPAPSILNPHHVELYA